MSGGLSPTSSSASSPVSPSRPIMERRASSRSNLSLDLSSLPPLDQPTPPTNTLLITNLNDRDIFRPDNLQTIRGLIEAAAPINTWSPLKSFRRIVVSFADEQAAVKVRALFDGEAFMGERCRVYFGQHTPLDLGRGGQKQHLNLPDAGKLFFISPPPSPPHGWEMRLEDAPNKLVHADDLAEALARLHHHHDARADVSPISPTEGAPSRTRSRSSTLIYQPHEHGGSPNLPAISVDDMTDSPMAMSPTLEQSVITHTSRPPVELMEDASFQ
ncbi:Calcipressin-domain-containing protein [Xylariaceae sp. FL0804]|nr:Calcipressin-domain-containing protein [Xylariaceae sp. FL0804]